MAARKKRSTSQTAAKRATARRARSKARTQTRAALRAKKAGATPAARTRVSSRTRIAAKRQAKPAVRSALALLRADHEEVDALFKRYEARKEKMTDRQKAALAGEICTALTVHARIEEEIFYPTVRPQIDDDALMNEAEVEHESLKALIARIEGGSPADEIFDAHVKVLAEYVKHHVKEEQSEMFKKVRRTDIDLKELGARLMRRKDELMAEAKGEVAGPGAPRRPAVRTPDKADRVSGLLN